MFGEGCQNGDLVFEIRRRWWEFESTKLYRLVVGHVILIT